MARRLKQPVDLLCRAWAVVGDHFHQLRFPDAGLGCLASSTAEAPVGRQHLGSDVLFFSIDSEPTEGHCEVVLSSPLVGGYIQTVS